MTVTVMLDNSAKGVFTPASLTSSGFASAGAGSYTFMGTAAAAQTAIRLLSFDPANNRVAVGQTETTTFTVSVNDGVASPVTNNTTTAVSTSINDAPTFTGYLAGQAVNDTGTIMPFATVVIGDMDSPAQSLTVTIGLDNAAKGVFTSASLTASGFILSSPGIYTFSGTASAAQTAIRLLAFDPADNRVAVGLTETTSFAVGVTDGLLVGGNSLTSVVSTSVNDAPTLGGAVSSQAVTDVTTVNPFSTFTVTDADPGQSLTVSVTIDNAAKGVFTPASLTASGFNSSGGGVYTYNGTASAAQFAIRQLVFNPTNYRVAPGSGETTTFTVTANDHVASSATNNTTTVVSTATNAVPTLTSISAFSGATARAEYTITYAQLLSASNAADANSTDVIRFRIETVSNGELLKNGESVVTGVTTIGVGESVVWSSSGEAAGTTGAFTVRAYDGAAASANAISVNVGVTAIDPVSAAVNAPVAASSGSSGLVSVVTRNDAGDTILLQQTNVGGDWNRINLTTAGVPDVTGGTTTFVDSATGRAKVTVVTDSGLFLLTDTGTGVWTSRNLTTELNGPMVTGELTSFSTTDGLNVVAGRTGAGDVVIYNQTGGTNGQGQPAWEAVNLYNLLRNQSETTPAFETTLTSYVTSWNGLNIAGLDSSGNIWTVWTGGGLGGWHSTNLSAITGAPALNGGVTAYTTSWGGINLAGIDSNGELSVTWWVPSFGGTWVNSNFTDQFGGPALRPGSVTSYVTNWNALNIAGVTTDGEIVQYWWVPPSSPDQDTWRVTPLTSSLSSSLRRPTTGGLTGIATPDSRLNLIGSSDDGHIIRLWWSPTQDWALEDLTNLV